MGDFGTLMSFERWRSPWIYRGLPQVEFIQQRLKEGGALGVHVQGARNPFAGRSPAIYSDKPSPLDQTLVPEWRSTDSDLSQI